MSAAEVETTGTPTIDGAAADLRAVADWLEAHPELEATASSFLQMSVSLWPDSAEDISTARKALGSYDKKYEGFSASFERKFGSVVVRVRALRSQVCTKTVTKIEEEVTEPDPDAVAALPVVTRTVVREIVEWDCGSVLAAGL